MTNSDRSTVGRFLPALSLQSLLLLPMAFSRSAWAETRSLPSGFLLLNVVIVGVVTFLVVRNLARLWRVPAAEASRTGSLALALVGMVFLLLAAGPLFSSERLSTKPLGAAEALVGSTLVVLGVRDAFRQRRQAWHATSG